MTLYVYTDHRLGKVAWTAMNSATNVTTLTWRAWTAKR